MSVQAENSRLCSFLNSLGYNGSVVIWTVVCLTATKFKPLVFLYGIDTDSVIKYPTNQLRQQIMS
jgi:hypothetical protein